MGKDRLMRSSPSRSAAATAPQLEAYRLLTWLACPMAGWLLRSRLRRGKEDKARLPERLGHPSLARPRGPLVWVHAASVGEANSVLPLIQALVSDRPDLWVLFTTGTVTSARLVADRLPQRTLHQYAPLDAPQLVGRFLDFWRPSLAVFTEQEIWPNLIVGAGKRQIPMVVVNARMSETSHLRWQRRRRLSAALFSQFALVLSQSEAIAARFRSLGAAQVDTVGNLKIDAPAPRADPKALRGLEEALAGRPRFLAASTHPGEEGVVATAHRMVAKKVPGLVTIIAPRHPERGEAIVRELSAAGLTSVRRALGGRPDTTTDIYVADTMGELGTLYALSPVAFIGGSLIPHGGQNPIEAVRHGAVVVTGPSRENFAEPYDALLSAGGAFLVADPPSLARCVEALLTCPERVDDCRRRATEAINRLAGALERTLAALRPLLPAPQESERVP
jgi:3-deoxy-D-manno-octulosonic-acid transferase